MFKLRQDLNPLHRDQPLNGDEQLRLWWRYENAVNNAKLFLILMGLMLFGFLLLGGLTAYDNSIERTKLQTETQRANKADARVLKMIDVLKESVPCR
jgi:hypothetical protein